MSISGIYALYIEPEIDTTISTAGVDIDLKEYNNLNNEFTENGKIVMPGEEISLIPKVNNLGVDCYIRANISYKINNINYNVENYIDGDYKNWTKSDDYYYYDPVLKKNTSVNIFNKISIPVNVPNTAQGKKVILRIKVDAIQAKHFDGNWKDIDIKKSIDRTYDMSETGSTTIVFNNNADKHITLDDKFFDNLGSLLPGDSKREIVKINNTSKTKNNYYLTIKHKKLTKQEKKLIKKLKLTITNSKNKKVLSASLDNVKKVKLGTYKSNEKDELKFTVLLPKDSDNEYSKLLTKITWIFSLKETKRTNPIINPNTGDFKTLISMIMFITSAIGLLVIIVLINKEKYKEKVGDKNEK